MMTKKVSMITVIVAILCIAVLEGIALWCGIDGKGFGIAVAAIAGLAGFKLKSIIG